MSENGAIALVFGVVAAVFLAIVMTPAMTESARAEACRLKGGILIRTATDHTCVKAEVLTEGTRNENQRTDGRCP